MFVWSLSSLPYSSSYWLSLVFYLYTSATGAFSGLFLFFSCGFFSYVEPNATPLSVFSFTGLLFFCPS